MRVSMRRLRWTKLLQQKPILSAILTSTRAVTVAVLVLRHLSIRPIHAPLPATFERTYASLERAIKNSHGSRRGLCGARRIFSDTRAAELVQKNFRIEISRHSTTSGMNMIISENDKRLYRLITLKNGLKAMLISSANDTDAEMRDDEEESRESG